MKKVRKRRKRYSIGAIDDRKKIDKKQDVYKQITSRETIGGRFDAQESLQL